MSPEVLIYIQNVKNYFKNDENARNYFLNEIDEDLFFQYLSEISQKNFEKEGQPLLSVDQFENLRKSLLFIHLSKKDFPEEPKKEDNDKIFLDIGRFGKICLN